MKRRIRFKRLFAFLLSVLFIIAAFFVVPASATGTTEISFGDVWVDAGAEAKLPISIKNNHGIAGLRFKLTYDTSALTFISIEKCLLADSGTVVSKINEENQSVTFLWYTNEDISEDGEFFTLNFRVSKSAVRKYFINVSYLPEDILSADQTVIECEVSNGTININHVYGEWYTVTPAAFYSDGQERRDCKNCEYYETRRIPKLSESHICNFSGREVIVTNPTCTTPGSKNIYCFEEECGKYENVSIPNTDHRSSEWIQSVEPGCEREGERIKKCADCYEVLETEKITPTGHNYLDWVIVEKPTAQKEGSEKRVCSVCYNEEIRSIPKLKYLPGDINDDTVVDLTDVVTLAQVVAEWNVECNVNALDVNGDGDVSLTDVVHLAQYVAEWQGIELH